MIAIWRMAFGPIGRGALTRGAGAPGAGGIACESGLVGGMRLSGHWRSASEVLVIGALLELLHEGPFVRRGHVELELHPVEEIEELGGLELSFDIHGPERIGLRLDLGGGTGARGWPRRPVVSASGAAL